MCWLSMPQRVLSCIIALASALAGARVARAGEEPLKSAPGAIRLEILVGGASLRTVRPATPQPDPSRAYVAEDRVGQEAVTGGIALDSRSGLLLLGVSFEGTLTFHQFETFAGVHAGLTYRAPGGFEISAMPEYGLHRLANVGSELFSNSHAPAVTLPYVGGRIGLAHVASKGNASPGIWLFARADRERSQVVTEVEGVFGPNETYVFDVGGYALGAALCVRIGDKPVPATAQPTRL
jgi:hypothetical protein